MRIGIMGAGAAGLSAAWFLRDSGHDVHVLEAGDEVGGLARSFDWHGFRCDIAPHRLYTNDERVLRELTSLVPMNRMRRNSRIFIQGKWVADPVNAAEIMLKFLPFKSLAIGWHYLFRKRVPEDQEDSFEAMVLSRFGRGLNEFFFKPYSEKLFGIPGDQISPEWGRRKLRVSGFKDMIRRNTKLYFRSFHYPKEGGYGSICDALYAHVGESVHLQTRLEGLTERESGGYTARLRHDGQAYDEDFDVVISTLPISNVASLLGETIGLRFRAADIYYLLVNQRQVSPNHWVYFADGDYCLNRVSEFRNFQGAQPDEDRTVLCCEVTATERASLEKVVAELHAAGMVNPEDVLDSMIIPIARAYPIYDRASDQELALAAAFFGRHPRLHLLGRNAQFAHRDVDEIFDEARYVVERVLEGIAADNLGGASPGRRIVQLGEADAEHVLEALAERDTDGRLAASAE